MAKEKKAIKYNTIVLDTATEVENVLNQAVFEYYAALKDNKQKLAPNEYVLRNLRMAALFDHAANAGITLVSIQYIKSKWLKDNKGNFYDTGELMVDGWQRTESAADINLQIDKRTIKVVSSRFGIEEGTTHRNVTLDDLSIILLGDAYGDDEELPNILWSITGGAKSGKTHLAFTAEPPIKVFCFNRGADFVRRRFPNKQIDIVNYHLPVIDELLPEAWAGDIWDKFYSDFKKAVGV